MHQSIGLLHVVLYGNKNFDKYHLNTFNLSSRVSINFLIYFLLLTTTITTVGTKFFGKIWSILFIDGIIEYFIQYLIRWSIECYLIVQESYVFVFFRDAG